MTIIPSLKRLLIPHKTMTEVTQPGYGNDMRQIEQWANALSTGYASLTGPGEESTPGSLTQQGDFTVNGSASSLFINGGNAELFGGTVAAVESTVEVFISCSGISGNAGNIDLVAATNTMSINGPQFLRLFSQGTEMIRLDNGSRLGFWGGSGIARPTITGSRGGNVALANLLTQLQAYGLIVDSTTV